MHSDVNPPGPINTVSHKRIKPAVQAFHSSPIAWRLDQTIHHLNATGTGAEVQYRFLIDMLASSRDELLATIEAVFQRSDGSDAALRWNLLYILGDAGGVEAVDFLVRVAALQQATDSGAQSSASADLEMLVATEAVHALRRIAARYPRVFTNLWQLVKRRPPRPILFEIAQIAAELGRRRQLKEVLAKEDQALLYMRRVSGVKGAQREGGQASVCNA